MAKKEKFQKFLFDLKSFRFYKTTLLLRFSGRIFKINE